MTTATFPENRSCMPWFIVGTLGQGTFKDNVLAEKCLHTRRPFRPERRLKATSAVKCDSGFRPHPPRSRLDMTSYRIGQGFDVHALVPDRPLIIGGVTIAYEKGLAGHSDADVLLHAITDALLGAAALGDIGRHFPDDDPKYRGADSRLLLRVAVTRVRAAGFLPVNIDCTIIAEKPKMAPHVAAMAANIAADCGIAAGAVNVKAKSTERLGFTGRGEGIAAEAVALVEKFG